MTPQEIINEYRKLPFVQRKEVLENLADDLRADEPISEAEIAERLLAAGVISEIPENWNEADEDFELIEVKLPPPEAVALFLRPRRCAVTD